MDVQDESAVSPFAGRMEFNEGLEMFQIRYIAFF